MSAGIAPTQVVHYPDSDGKRMSDNTVQFNWISLLKWNAEAAFLDAPEVFVAGDHLIYPVEGRPRVRQAPDVYVAFGRPKRDRGSYKVWEEGGIFPQVVFEVWSPNNRYTEMNRKFRFYDRHGAEEYTIVYPEFPGHLEGWVRIDGKLRRVPAMHGHVSPRLNWRFEQVKGELKVFGADGRQLRTPDVIAKERDAALDRAERLAAKLRELGGDPEAV